MSKFLLVGDVHLDINEPREKQVDINGHLASGRILTKLEMLKKTVALAIQHKVDWYIDLGDLFNHLNPSEWLRELYSKNVLAPLLKHGIKIRLIAGNHGNEKTSIALRSLKDINLNFFFDDVFAEIEPGIYVLPFYPLKEQDKLQELLSPIRHGVLFTHLPISGAKNYSEFALEGFPLGMFNVLDLVVSGHYHRQQQIDNIFYLGSLGSNNWSEPGGERRGVVIYDSNKATLSTFPVMDKIFVNWYHALPNDIIDYLEKANSWKDITVKIKVSGTKSQLITFNHKDVMAYLYSKGAHLVYIDYEQVEDNERNTVLVDSAQSNDKIMLDIAKGDTKLVEFGKQFLVEK